MLPEPMVVPALGEGCGGGATHVAQVGVLGHELVLVQLDQEVMIMCSWGWGQHRQACAGCRASHAPVPAGAPWVLAWRGQARCCWVLRMRALMVLLAEVGQQALLAWRGLVVLARLGVPGVVGQVVLARQGVVVLLLRPQPVLLLLGTSAGKRG